MTKEDPRDAGWKADPKGKFAGRYWDGSAWTERVNPGAEEATDPIKNTAMTKYPEPDTKRYASLVKGHQRVAKLNARSAERKEQLQEAKGPPEERSPRQVEIEAMASDKLDMRLGVNRELKELVQHLHDDEQLLTMARGGLNKAAGIVVVTNERVVFLDKRMIGHHFEDFPLKAITSISASQAMVSAKVKIYAGSHFTEVTDVIPKQRGQEIVDAVRGAQAASAPNAEPAGTPSSSKLDQLEQLGRLRDAGVLSGEEFDAEKRKVLDS